MGAPSAYGRIYPWLSNPILVAVTNGTFSLAARNLAKERGVTVLDRFEVCELPGRARNWVTGEMYMQT